MLKEPIPTFPKAASKNVRLTVLIIITAVGVVQYILQVKTPTSKNLTSHHVRH